MQDVPGGIPAIEIPFATPHHGELPERSNGAGSKHGVPLAGTEGSNSPSLHQRVGSEPDFLGVLRAGLLLGVPPPSALAFHNSEARTRTPALVAVALARSIRVARYWFHRSASIATTDIGLSPTRLGAQLDIAVTTSDPAIPGCPPPDCSSQQFDHLPDPSRSSMTSQVSNVIDNRMPRKCVGSGS
jgi:hypothetical protein